MNQKTLQWIFTGVGVLLLLAFPIVYEDQPYLVHIGIVALFYAILASSWSLLAGYAGQFSFAHMAFMAIGAYTTGVLGKFWGVSPWLGIPVGILMGGVWGFLVGVLVLRLRRTYLALFTIGFSEILRVAFNAEIDITDGPNGLEFTPLFPEGVNLFGVYFNATHKTPPYLVMLILFLLSMVIMYWLAGSRFGLFVRAIREDEEAASALGVHVVSYRVLVFVVTSMIAAAAGAVEGHYIGVVTPNIFLILQMSLVIAMAVIGGLESLVGAAIGAIIIEFMLEFLRTSFEIGPLTIDMTVWRLVFFGALLMITLRFFGNGLIQPLIWRLTRAGTAEETVAKRVAAAGGTSHD
ncbi:MAG: branched-chain amino acid ABC transporter permease [Anaerolineae bacterium]